MTSKLTREQAEDTIEGLEGLISRGVQSVYLDMAIAGMRQLIATLDSEPVAWRRFQETPSDGGYWILYDYSPNCSGVEPLYRHAQPASAVPQDVLDALQKVARIRRDLNDFDGDRRGIADCLCDAEEALIEVVNRRSAMLAAAPQPPGSEPATVPGKWIPVSERMPIDFEAVIAFDGDQVYGEAMYSSDDGFTIDGYEPCDRLKLQNVTHWMPMPAAPQEVK
ncbi:DUF551 domain-containing protein [Klebsiella pneumoniae]|nr:DUF551 domain-containing protein [Klebsiella pneumoniae]